MGNKPHKLKASKIQQFILLTKKRFNEKEIKCLHSHFLTISALDIDDGQIDIGEFKAALGLPKSNFFVERIFHIFDRNGDGKISFAEFLEGLAVLCHKAPDRDKLYFSFRIYDVDEDGKISRNELHKMMKACLKCFPHPFTDEQISTIISATFKEGDTDKDGFISFEEYSALVVNHPMMLHQMSINVSQRIAEMQKAKSGLGKKMKALALGKKKSKS